MLLPDSLKMLQQTSDAVIVLEEGTIEFWNKSAEFLFGFSPEQARGKDFFRLLEISQQDLPGAGDTAVLSCSGIKKNRVDVQLEVAFRNQSSLGLLMRPLPVTQARNGSDVISQELRISRMMAHDLRNPLATLVNLSYIFETRAEARHIKLMRRQLSLCGTIIENLMVLGGARFAEPEKVDAVQIVHEVLESIIVPDTIVTTVTGERSAFCFTNANQIVQALINIFQNAIDSVSQMERGFIRFDVEQNDSFVFIRISDNGNGVPEETKKDLFKPHVTTKEKGFGLDLFASKELILSNHGEIFFENQPEGGACFTVRLHKR